MNTNTPLSLIVLAAGKGTRMKSEKAKVLHEVFYAPMVHHVLNAITPLGAGAILAIVGHQREAVIDSLANFPAVTPVVQEEQAGTGHAVAIAEQAVPADCETVMILCGDTPLIRPETLLEMYAQHKAQQADLTVMTTLLDNPTNYGRIVSDAHEGILGIVEEKDADPEQKRIREINAGIYCVSRRFLFDALRQVDTNNSQGEVYLTDIVSIGVQEGRRIRRYMCPYGADVLGVNSRVELAQAHTELQLRRNREVMLQGVTILSPETVSISPAATVGRDSLIKAGVELCGKTTIGERCVLGNGALLTDCEVGDGVEIGPYAVLSNCRITANSRIAPHSTQG